MKNKSFSLSILVDRAPDDVFAAINDVRRWWSGEIHGDTDKLGAEFTYRHGTVHRSSQTITELVPGRRVVWHVVDSDLSFLEHKTEWNGTDIVFDISPKRGKTEIRFEHRGLVPQIECYDSCSSAWGALINGNLQRLILTGETQPDPFV